MEFLDVREAALVSVAESLARRALPWQAQLCPRALQDLEIARVKVSMMCKGSVSQRRVEGELLVADRCNGTPVTQLLCKTRKMTIFPSRWYTRRRVSSSIAKRYTKGCLVVYSCLWRTLMSRMSFHICVVLDRSQSLSLSRSLAWVNFWGSIWKRYSG